MVFRQILSVPTRNFAYLFADRPGGSGIVVDPGPEAAPAALLEAVRRARVRVEAIVLTHHHADHVVGATRVAADTRAAVRAHPETVRLLAGRVAVDRHLADDEILRWGEGGSARVLATPGHAPGSVCLVVNDAWLVTGDTLFIGDCGRTDLPGGDAQTLYESLQRLKTLPDHLEVCPGHDYGPVPRRTLGEEKALNASLRAADFEQFAAIP
jgi:glyoxylase-like metal-dependent hydrolase (beta-lactamase superfamily II)